MDIIYYTYNPSYGRRILTGGVGVGGWGSNEKWDGIWLGVGEKRPSHEGDRKTGETSREREKGKVVVGLGGFSGGGCLCCSLLLNISYGT